jgi:O-antigen ligase
MAYTILLTGSRGGFLVLIVTSAMCIWSFAIRGRRPYLVALVAALAVIVSVSSASMIIGRLKGTFDASQDVAAAYASGQARQQLFWRSVEVTKENPLFGVGPGNFVQLSGDWHVAHNSYTQMSSEGGIPALALYLLILGSGFKNLRAAKRFAIRQRETLLLAKALHASLLGFVVGSFFLTQNYSYFPYFLIAYTTALFTISEKSDGARRAVEAARQTIATRPPRTAEQEFEMPSFSPQTQ